MTEAKVWPHQELGKELSNWGRWGDDDEIGTMNFVTPQKRVEAAKLVKTGKVIDMGIPYDKNGPFLPDGFRQNPTHLMTFLPADTAGVPDGMISADDMVIMGLQAATQWDSLAHVGYGGYFYNGVPAAAVNNFVGASKNSYTKANSSLVSRGVLLDIARLKGVERLEESYEITADDLSAAEEAQGVQVKSGDILLLRTGWHQFFAAGDKVGYNGPEPGPGYESCRWFYEREVAALATDNWAVEVYPCPVPGAIIPFHQVAIRDMGMMLGEMFDFEELSADCADDGVYEFLFTGTGIKVTGGVGSPLTPLAFK